MSRGILALVGVIVAIWVLLLLLKVAFKLVGLAILVGVALLIFAVVKDKLGGRR